MQSLIAFGIHVLEALFLVGLVGSALVFVRAATEDIEILLGRHSDEEH